MVWKTTKNHQKGNKSQMLSFWIEWVKTWFASNKGQPVMRTLDLDFPDFPDFPDFQPTLPLTPAVQERYQAVRGQAEQRDRLARIASQRDSYAAQLREFQRMALEDDVGGPPSIDEINRAVMHVALHGYQVSWGRIEHRIAEPDP